VSHRLEAPAGARIDRTRPLSFTFNGRTFGGFSGDTLASALLANDVRLVARSFKLHRPRGVFTCGVEEPNAIVDVGAGTRRTPNVRATLLPLVEGLTATSVNCWPSVGFDVGALNGAFAALLPAGFYYKTFKWPSWRLFEPAIRRMAGLGVAPTDPDSDHYEEVAAEADVLIIGGGAAGLAAAAAAARAGARTLLLEGAVQVGGARSLRADPDAGKLAAGVQEAGVRVLTRTLGFGVYDHNLVCAVESVRRIRTCPHACCASGCGGSAPAASSPRPAPSSGRWSFPITIVPASCWPAPRSSTHSPTASRAGAAR